MFASRFVLVVVVMVALALAALGVARPSSGAGEDVRYVVEPGDTLWGIASSRYGGDPREAIWRIQERNGLESPLLRPGMVLRLPGAAPGSPVPSG